VTGGLYGAVAFWNAVDGSPATDGRVAVWDGIAEEATLTDVAPGKW